MRTAVASVLIAFFAAVPAAARATSIIVGPEAWPAVELEGEPASRCAQWAERFGARELERARDLALPTEELEAWARVRAEKAAGLCRRFSLIRASAWPADRALTDADLGLPPGFTEGSGLSESDLRTWQKAATHGAEVVRLHTPEREALLGDRARSGCDAEPDAIRHEGPWLWCRPKPWTSSTEKYLEDLQKTFVRVFAVGSGVLVACGFGLLLFLGRRAASQKAGPRPPPPA